MIHINCNDQILEIPQNTTLSQFLENRNMNAQGGVAVAVNNQVVSKDRWEETILQENDHILIIGAYYGG